MKTNQSTINTLCDSYSLDATHFNGFKTISSAQSVLHRLEVNKMADSWGTSPDTIDSIIQNSVHENINNVMVEDSSIVDKVLNALRNEVTSIKYDSIKHNYIRYGVLTGSFVLHIGGVPPQNTSMIRAAYVTPFNISDSGTNEWLSSLVVERNLYDYDDASATCYRQETHESIESAHKWVVKRINQYNHIPFLFNDFSSGLFVSPTNTDDIVDFPIRSLNTERIPASIKRQYKRQYNQEITGENFNRFTDIEIIRPDVTQTVMYDIQQGEYISLIPFNGGYTMPRHGCMELGAGDGGKWISDEEVRERNSAGRYTSPNTL